MALVRRFKLPGAAASELDIFVRGVGMFVKGIYDVPSADTSTVSAVRAIVLAQGGVEVGEVDTTVVPPPSNAANDPYPQYLSTTELAENITGGSGPVVQALKAAFDAWGGGSGVDPEDTGFDIVVLPGQSNMQGDSGAGYDTRRDPADPRVWTFDYAGTYANTLTAAVDPLMHQGGNAGLGPGTAFGRWYAAARPGNRRVLLVPVALGGSPLTPTSGWATWNPSVRGDLYDNALAHTQRALAAAGPGSRVVAALWVQGEADAEGGVTESAYATVLDALIGQLRTDLASPTLPFVVGGMVPEFIAGNPATAGVAAAHAATPSRVANTYYLPGPSGMHKGDSLHYSPAGQRLIGRRMAAALTGAPMPPLPAPDTTEPSVPTGLTVGTVTDTTVPLSWTASTDAVGVTGYRVRRGGAVVGSPTATSYTDTGLTASTSYSYTVSAVDGAGNESAQTSAVPATTSADVPDVEPTWTVTDTFTRADSASLGTTETGAKTWTVVNGDWGIVSNQAAPGQTWGGSVVLVDLGTADHTIETPFAVVTGAGLHFRWVDASNWLLVQGDGTILRNVAGATEPVGNIGTIVGADVIRVVPIGSTVTVYKNGTQAVTFTDTLAGTKAGFRSDNGTERFDDFKAA